MDNTIAAPDGRRVWRPDTTTALLARAADLRPDAVAIVAGDLVLTYADYARAVAALARRLAALDAAGGTVAILLRNSASIAIAVMGAQAAGAAAAALNPDYTARELGPMLSDCAPKVAIVAAELLDIVRTLVSDDVVIIAVGADDPFVGGLLSETPCPLPTPDPDAVAVLQFTGGTTGRAKGVELTHRAVACNVAQREAVLPTEFGDERVPCFMPMFHSFAAAMCLNLCAYAGGALIVLPRYRPDWVVEALRTHAATRFCAGPTVFSGLLSFEGFTGESVSSLRSAYSGSAPLPRETVARWLDRTDVPVFEGYGQSEAGPVLTYQGPRSGWRLGSVGPPLPLTSIRIVDPNDPSVDLPIGVPGEILAHGPQIMRGYRGLPDETSKVLRDGWLHTGDIGSLDSDGHLSIHDRLKDMAIVGGFNVFPREIDEVLAMHAGVAAAAAVSAPDAYRGETIVAFVTPTGVFDEAALRAHCAANLVRYKHPEQFVELSALPLTPVGKIDKTALREMAKAIRSGRHVA